jgi:hypothetical protein
MSAIPPPPPSPYEPPTSDFGATGLDRIGKDSRLQELWVRRLVAFIVDTVILYVATFILAVIFVIPLVLGSVFSSLTSGFNFLPGIYWGSLFGFGFGSLLAGILYVLYYTIADHLWGGTLGKHVVGLRVLRAQSGYESVTRAFSQASQAGGGSGATAYPTFEQAFMRNISKIYWLLVLLDALGGLATRGDPAQKYSDRYARTTVVTHS